MTDFPINTRITVEFELHEVLGLAQLYEDAPDDLPLQYDGIWYGESVDLAMLRLGEALAKMTGNKEMLLRSGALRARIAQGESQ